MHHALALRIGAVMPVLVSQIPLDDAEMLRARDAVTALVQTMIDAAQAEGELRPDVAFGDISMLIIRLSRPLPGSFPQDLDDRLAHRHLDLLIAGLRATRDSSTAQLAGPALTLADLRALSDGHEPATQHNPPDQPIDQ